jgi:hypothetical protein
VYNSAVRWLEPLVPTPATTSTFDCACSSTAECRYLALAMGVAALHCWVAGSYTSTLLNAFVEALPNWPPATSTFPVLSREAVCRARALASAPTGLHWPVLGSYSSAEASTPPLLRPPVTSTLPEGSKMAVCS